LGPVTFKRHTLSVHALNLPEAALMTLAVARRVGKRYVTAANKTAAAAWVRLRVTSWDRVTARFIDPTGKVHPSSPATILRARHSPGYVPVRRRA
jgi:hypothetical protein